MKDFPLSLFIVFAVLACSSFVCAAPAEVPQTGQTIEDTVLPGDDGDLHKGVELPVPRFVDNSDGTITDALTGLIWLANASCFPISTWEIAISQSNALGNGQCDLTDGSDPGDWRLPNILELLSLVDFKYLNPSLTNLHPFNIVSPSYWSSTYYPTPSEDIQQARAVDFSLALMTNIDTTPIELGVWPVRGGATYARLNINMTGSGTGTVSNADFSCSSDCSYPYAINDPVDIVTLTATPATGSTFEGWGGACNANGQVTINADKTCTATFKKDSMLLLMMPAIIGGRENR